METVALAIVLTSNQNKKDHPRRMVFFMIHNLHQIEASIMQSKNEYKLKPLLNLFFHFIYIQTLKYKIM